MPAGEKIKITRGSGNVFVDMGFSEKEAAELTLKSFLFNMVQEGIRKSGLTQVEVAAKLGIDQPKVSKILNGKMSAFSIERLAIFLTRLKYDIHIGATKAARNKKFGAIVLVPIHETQRVIKKKAMVDKQVAG